MLERSTTQGSRPTVHSPILVTPPREAPKIVERRPRKVTLALAALAAMAALLLGGALGFALGRRFH